MTIPDEVLAAFVDGELEGAERARIEQAIAQDAQLAQRVAQQRALRDRLRGAYNGVLHEAVPQRLAHAVKFGAPDRSGPGDRSGARARRAHAPWQWATPESKLRRYSIAASLAVGLMAGVLIQRLAAPGAVTELHDGALLARGALAQALERAACQQRFAGRGGARRPDFQIQGRQFLPHLHTRRRSLMAGLACREQDRWQLLNLMAAEGAGAGRQRTEPAHGQHRLCRLRCCRRSMSTSAASR